MKKFVGSVLVLFMLTACGGSSGPAPVVDSLPDNTVVTPGGDSPSLPLDSIPVSDVDSLQ